jgi:hypothetical protein
MNSSNDHKSIILEVVVDQSFWIWYAFIRLPSDNNDLNVLDRSPLIYDLLQATNTNLVFWGQW